MVLPNNNKMNYKTAKRCFRYNPLTGLLYWKISRGGTQKDNNEAGCESDTGYIKITYRNESYLAHRLAWLLTYGEYPNEIDHINGNPADNRLINLRSVNHSGNGKNQRLSSKIKSGIYGICFHNGRKKWHTRINNNGKRFFLGYFKDFFEACCARKSAENKYNYHPNHGRR